MQDNQTYLQKIPIFPHFYARRSAFAGGRQINYALRCEQGETRLLALKVEPYNLLLFGEEACVPELLRFCSTAAMRSKTICARRSWVMY